MLSGYHNKFNPDDHYEQVLFRSGKGLQTRELNELQSMQAHSLRRISDVIFEDGNISKGGQITIDLDTSTATAEEGDVYIRGQIRTLKESTLNIPLIGKVLVGVWLEETEITELDDKALLNPAKQTRGYQEPGAGRLHASAQWGLEHDKRKGDFYPVHEIQNGVVIVKSPPPQLDAVTAGLARYDRESNGSYITSGYRLSYLHTKGKLQHYTFSEGKAHVEGYEISRTSATPLPLEVDPTLETINSEPHPFEPDSKGVMRITLDHKPQHIKYIDITAEKTVSLTHGAYSGVKDPLDDRSILKITRVMQGRTSYSIGKDVNLTKGTVDWSSLGKEPAPGSSYKVTYQYRKKIEGKAIPTKKGIQKISDPVIIYRTADSNRVNNTATKIDGTSRFVGKQLFSTAAENRQQDDTDLVITGAVKGSLVLVDYEWALPRVDILTIDKDGEIRRIKGLSHAWKPPVPDVPNSQLLIARIYQDWVNPPDVSNDGIRVVPMSDLEQMQDEITDLYDLVAIERLKTDAMTRDPASKRGVFVDPFIDNDLRDEGIDQDAAIVDGVLMLPIEEEVIDSTLDKAQLLDCKSETILQQLGKTGDMKINPYQAFEPLPVRVSLHPWIDNWSIVVTRWASTVTRIFVRDITIGGWGRLSRTTTSTTTRNSQRLLSRRFNRIAHLRRRTVAFSIEGFGPGETLKTVRFDGVEVTAK